MARRIAALVGFLAVVALALALLYRVWIHHSQAEPYVDEREGNVVRLDAGASSCVKFASLIR